MREKVLSRLCNVKDLPSFPEIAAELMSIVSREDFSIGDLKKIIEKDPGLVTKILKVANSFAFNPVGKEITSIERAIIQLGVNNLVPIVVGLSVIQLNKYVDERFNAELFWKHSYTCAHVAKRLAARFKLPEGEAFTAGLLHDIGKLVLFSLYPVEYMKALELSKERNLFSFEAEREVFGVDHCEVGEYVIDHWGLPKLLREVVRYHHSPNEATDYKKFTALVGVADLFSRVTGLYYNRDFKGVDLLNEPAWKILTGEEEDPESLLLPVYTDAEDAIAFAEIAWGRK